MTSRDPDTRPSAGEVAAAARTLPAPIAPELPSDETQAWEAEDTRGKTRRLPVVGSGETTTVLGAEADASATADTLPRRLPASGRPRLGVLFADRRGRIVAASVVAAAVLVGAAALLVPSAPPAESTSTPAASLPALPAPLDTDMQNLLEGVAP